MSGHRISKDLFGGLIAGAFSSPDPGDGATFAISSDRTIIELTCASGNETRYLPDPANIPVGTELFLTLKTLSGTKIDVQTAAFDALNQAGNTIGTMNAVGEMIAFKVLYPSGTKGWHIIANDGVGLSS